jgi:hypothetical protein
MTPITHAHRDEIRDDLLYAARNIRRARANVAADLEIMSEREDLLALANQLRALEICLVYADDALSAVKCEAP